MKLNLVQLENLCDNNNLADPVSTPLNKPRISCFPARLVFIQINRRFEVLR